MTRFPLDRILKIALIGCTVALIAVVADSLRDKIVEVGDKAPNFSITLDSGKKFDRAHIPGKLLVLNFWATWCPPCISEFPSLNAFAAAMRSKGVYVLGVSVDKDEKAYRRFLGKVHLNFDMARDPEANISADYGTFKYPETYVIGADGKVLEKFIADRDWTDPEIQRRIESYLR